jgi:putative ABC transport system permease protein
VRSVLLRRLPYPQAERLVYVVERFPGAGVERAGTSVPNYFDRFTSVPAFGSQALYRDIGFVTGDPGAAEGIRGMAMTTTFFDVLRTPSYRGRTFKDEDGVEGRNRVAILSYGFWQRAFPGSDAAIGRQIRLSDHRYTIIGVMPEGFAFIEPEIAVFVPEAFTAEQRSDEARHSQNHESIARLAPGITLAQAQQQLDAQKRLNIERPGPLEALLINAGYRTSVFRLDEDIVRNVRRTRLPITVYVVKRSATPGSRRARRSAPAPERASADWRTGAC